MEKVLREVSLNEINNKKPFPWFIRLTGGQSHHRTDAQLEFCQGRNVNKAVQTLRAASTRLMQECMVRRVKGIFPTPLAHFIPRLQLNFLPDDKKKRI